MSVQSEITRLADAKSAIATAIAGKGVTVPDGTKLDGMAALIGSIANQAELESITVKTPPSKLEYAAGETFDPTGMVLTVFVGEIEVDITTGYTVTPETIAADTSQVTISYTAGGKTVTTTQAITIKLFNPIFANNSWERIIEACQSGDAKTLWSVGDEKPVTIGDTEYVLQILGFDHYDLASTDEKYGDATYNGGSNKAALCLGLKDLLNDTYTFGTVNTSKSWHGASIYNMLNNTILPSMPSDLVSGIRLVSVKSYTSAGNITDTDKILLSSTYEVLGKSSDYRESYANEEGTQYAYYKAGNSASKHNSNGDTVDYWTRSKAYHDGNWYAYVCTITSSGVNTRLAGYTEYKPVSFVINL